VATIYDVAKRANVSSSTVSRVFNQPHKISEETRERVLQAAKELDYRPNAWASSLTTKRTRLVGLVCSDIQNPYVATLARGSQDASAQYGYLTIICSTDGDPELELELLKEMFQRNVDGFIIAPSQLGSNSDVDEYICELLDQNVPIVFVGNRFNDGKVDFVTSRAQDGAFDAVNHLISLGHERIGFIGGHYTRGVAVGRWFGYQEALIENQFSIRSEYMVEADLTREAGTEAMLRLLDLPTPPSAVITVNDLMAIGAMDACYQRGVAIPDDISLIGFDDIPLASLTQPGLTTVAQPAYDLGYKATELLMNRFDNPSLDHQHSTLRSKLIIRGTTASPHRQ